jgi:type I restriction enzyme S subunit
VLHHPKREAWPTQDLTAIARFVNGRAFTKDATGEERPILRIKELNNGVTPATLRADLEARPENIAQHHDLLFSWSGSLDVYRWHGPESLINQHIFKVIPNEGMSTWFVEAWLRVHLAEFRAIAKDKATTMGHIKREHLKAALVKMPPVEHLVELEAILAPIDAHLGGLAAETRDLVRLRDELLPRLLGPAAIEMHATARVAPPARLAA